jgi:hypothetical protein
MNNIIYSEILKRGLSLDDREFSNCKGMIFFGDGNLINYRGDEPYLIINKTNRIKINLSDLPILVNIAIDYIIHKREVDSISKLTSIERINVEIRNRKLKEILS